MKEINNEDLVSAYLNGELTDAEVLSFEAELDKDRDLQNELMFQYIFLGEENIELEDIPMSPEAEADEATVRTRYLPNYDREELIFSPATMRSSGLKLQTPIINKRTVTPIEVCFENILETAVFVKIFDNTDNEVGYYEIADGQKEFYLPIEGLLTGKYYMQLYNEQAEVVHGSFTVEKN